jgi:hypothetical protein
MWLHHLFNLLASATSIFVDVIGTTFLGLFLGIAFALATALATLWRIRLKHGADAMRKHWEDDIKIGLRVSLVCAAVIYIPVIVWSVGKAVYNDHQQLVQRSHDQRHAIYTDASTLQKSITDFNKQLADCGTQKATLTGTNGALTNQNRDQQNTINNCQDQALKLLAPQPFHHLVVVIDSEIVGNKRKTIWILLTNERRSSVQFETTCNTNIESLRADIGREGISSVSHDPNDLKVWRFQIASPAWTPESPIVVHTVTDRTNAITCTFEFEEAEK